MNDYHHQQVQSYYEPALNLLGQMLEQRKINLRKINRDETNAAVTRDEFIQAMNDRNVSVYMAGEIVASLNRANKIICFGRFIQLNDEGDV